MTAFEGPFNAKCLNAIIAEVEEWAREELNELYKSFYEAGYPFGADPVDPAEEYLTLVRLRDTGDPRYWHRPEAQRDLERLSKRFGAPPPVAVPDVAAQAPPGPQAPFSLAPTIGGMTR